MGSANHYDVIIIGTGAGGGTLAYHLASSGKRILLLERGGYLPREKDNWDSRAVFIESKYKAKNVIDTVRAIRKPIDLPTLLSVVDEVLSVRR